MNRRSLLLSLAAMACIDPVADLVSLAEVLSPPLPAMVWGVSTWGSCAWRTP